MPSVLFVCTGNICRSPMAAAIFQQMVDSKPDAKEWRVESAGTWAAKGMPASHNAQVVLASRFLLDLSGHRSRQISREILQPFDLVLTMERGHKEALRAEFPEISERVYLLSEMVDMVHDIRDPIGGLVSDYEETALQLKRLLLAGEAKIRLLAEQAAEKRAEN